MEKVRIFEAGVDGGGMTVFKNPDGSVTEIGDSWGIDLDDEEYVNKWERKFKSFEEWFLDFKTKNGDFWIFFHPVFIDEEIRTFINNEVNNYKFKEEGDINDYHREKWLRDTK